MKTFLETYFLIDVADYFGEAYHFPITSVLFFLTVGLILASIGVYQQKKIVYITAKRLFRHNAVGEENAKTVRELGLSNQRAVCRALAKNVKIGHFVERAGDVKLSYEEYVALQKAKKLPKETVDLERARFYIAPSERDRAASVYERTSVSILQPIVAVIALIALFLILMFSMPSLLSLIASVI